MKSRQTQSNIKQLHTTSSKKTCPQSPVLLRWWGGGGHQIYDGQPALVRAHKLDTAPWQGPLGRRLKLHKLHKSYVCLPGNGRTSPPRNAVQFAGLGLSLGLTWNRFMWFWSMPWNKRHGYGHGICMAMTMGIPMAVGTGASKNQ